MAKAKISISLEVDLIRWIDEQVKKGIYKSRSGCIQKCIERMLEGIWERG